jgi:hypothetical protein
VQEPFEGIFLEVLIDGTNVSKNRASNQNPVIGITLGCVFQKYLKYYKTKVAQIKKKTKKILKKK